MAMDPERLQIPPKVLICGKAQVIAECFYSMSEACWETYML